MPALIAAGRIGHASIIRARSGSVSGPTHPPFGGRSGPISGLLGPVLGPVDETGCPNLFADCVLWDSDFGIIIRVSGVRIPPPLFLACGNGQPRAPNSFCHPELGVSLSLIPSDPSKTKTAGPWKKAGGLVNSPTRSDYEPPSFVLTLVNVAEAFVPTA